MSMISVTRGQWDGGFDLSTIVPSPSTLDLMDEESDVQLAWTQELVLRKVTLLGWAVASWKGWQPGIGAEAAKFACMCVHSDEKAVWGCAWGQKQQCRKGSREGEGQRAMSP